MKKLRTILAVLLLLAMTLTALVSCAGGSDNSDKKKDNEDKGSDDTVEIPGINVSEYKLVRPYSASVSVIGITSVLKDDIAEFTKVDLPVRIDVDETDKSGYEILVGKTDREESTQLLETLSAKTKKQAFAIKAYDKKIAIVGLDDNDTLMGVRYFINNFVSKSTVKNEIAMKEDFSVMKKTGDVLYVTPDYHVIVREVDSTIFKPTDPDDIDDYNATYGKIIKLEHQKDAKNNGKLLATHETIDGSAPPVFLSKDDGRTWEKLSVVKDTLNPGGIVGYQSYLFELPADVGQFKKGTLLFAGCTRVAGDTRMVLYSSLDLGKTWTAFVNVDIHGPGKAMGWDSDGLWEPVLQYEDGRVYCFYSDERLNGTGTGHVGGHNQRLVYKYSTDLMNWSELKECAVSEDPEDRPGMVALTKMGNGKWALVFEQFYREGYSGCPIALKFADSLDSWDAADMGKIIKNAQGKNMGSAPAITWTPLGGECGTLFVTASGRNTPMYVSFDYGETFVSFDNPIDMRYFGNGEVRLGYSPGLFTSKEGEVYYVNNPKAYENYGSEKLAFAKLVVY